MSLSTIHPYQGGTTHTIHGTVKTRQTGPVDRHEYDGVTWQSDGEIIREFISDLIEYTVIAVKNLL